MNGFCLVRLLILSVVLTAVSPSKERQFILTASSLFRMVIAETTSELGLESKRIIEEAAAEHLLLVSAYRGSNKQPVRVAEVVIQETVLQRGQNETWIKFFVLATVRADNRDDTSEYERRLVLNALIIDAFSVEKSHVFVNNAVEKDRFQDSTSVELGDLVSANVAPFVPAVTEEPADSEVFAPEPSLSTLDIVLIVVSICILVGILWMIAVHHMDRGYFENQRLFALNNNNQSPHWETEAKNQFDEELAATRSSESHQQLFHASTTISLDDRLIDSQANAKLRSALKRPVTPIPASRRDAHVEFVDDGPSDNSDGVSDFSSDESVAALSAVNDGIPAPPEIPGCPLSIGFENNLFRTPDSKGPSRSEIVSPDDESIYTTNEDSVGQSKPTDGWDQTSDVDDVFHVGDAGAKSSAADVESRRNTPDDMSNWLRSLHVVPSSDSRDRMNRRSKGFRNVERPPTMGASTVSSPRPRATSLEVASIDHLSLEQSMASSTVAPVLLNSALTM